MPGSKGYKCTPEQKKNISNGMKKFFAEHPEAREKLSASVKKAMTPAVRKKISKAKKGKDPWNKGKTGIYSVETRQRISNTVRSNYETGKVVHPTKDPARKEEIGKKISESLKKTIADKGHWVARVWEESTDEERKSRGDAISIAKLVQYATDEEFAKRHREALRTPEVRQKLSDSALAYWSSLSDVARAKHLGNVVAAVTNKKPTSHEKELVDLFARFEVPFEYVGDGSFMIGNRCPDFIWKSRKIVLEYDGVSYWHKDKDRDRQRNKCYKDRGWRVISLRCRARETDAHQLLIKILKFVKSKFKFMAFAIRGPRLVRVKA